MKYLLVFNLSVAGYNISESVENTVNCTPDELQNEIAKRKDSLCKRFQKKIDGNGFNEIASATLTQVLPLG